VDAKAGRISGGSKRPPTRRKHNQSRSTANRAGDRPASRAHCGNVGADFVVPVAFAQQVSAAADGAAGSRLERSSRRGGSFID